MNEKTVYGLPNPYDCDNATVMANNTKDAHIEFLFEDEAPVEINQEHGKETFPEQLSANQAPNQVKSNDKCNKQTSDSLLPPEPSVEESWKSYTPNDLKRPKNPLLDSSSSKQVKVNDNSRTRSRRRPTIGVKTLTSSIVAQKYDLLLDKRLVLVEMQIKQIEEEHNLNLKKKKLEIELLQLELSNKKKELGI